MRWMCLGCGRFWETEEALVHSENFCPYCRDIYWTDNIVKGIPIPLGRKEVKLDCGHEFIVEESGDLKWCTFCGKKVEGASGTTLREWQEIELERLRIC